MKIVRKALAYIYRDNQGVCEVLVFNHEDHYGQEINPQVPSGTLRKNESPESAILREVFEEAGLEFKKHQNYLGTFDFKREEIGEIHRRDVFEFETDGLKESWVHHVSSDDEDDGMIFHYYWLPARVAKEKLVAEMGNYLPAIDGEI